MLGIDSDSSCSEEGGADEARKGMEHSVIVLASSDDEDGNDEHVSAGKVIRDALNTKKQNKNKKKKQQNKV